MVFDPIPAEGRSVERPERIEQGLFPASVAAVKPTGRHEISVVFRRECIQPGAGSFDGIDLVYCD
jgi:hypothetical protein